MKINLQKLNPFKKKDQKRDRSGKFTAGSGGLSTVKKFNLKRNAPVITIVALVGGVLVYRSFAGVSLYRYQYSAYQCPSFSKDAKDTNASNSCVNNSAEGLTYRLYEGIFGREPDDGGYKYWTQKMAGDRTKPSEVAKSMLDAQSASAGLSNQDFVAKLYTVSLKRTADKGGLEYYTGKLDKNQWTRERLMQHFAGVSKVDYNVINLLMTASDNQTFVEQLYASLFGRQGDSAGVQYWTNQINQGKQGKNNVLAAFAASSEAVTKHGAGFANYVSSAPKVEVVQTAKKKQDERLFVSAVRVNDAKKAFDPIKGLTDNGRKNRDTAKSIASKATPSRSDLSAIASNQRTVEGYQKKVPDVQRKLAIWAGKNKALYDEAKTVSDWSPDLSSDAIKKNYDTVAFYLALANNMNKDLGNLIKDISGQYKAAEKKYEAEQRRLAEEAARKAAEDAASRRTLDPVPDPKVDPSLFTTPARNCKGNGKFVAVSGRVRLNTKDGKTRRINAMNCRKQGIVGSGTDGYNQQMAQHVCSSPYKAFLIKKTMLINIEKKEYAPDGWICYRGDASDLVR